MKEKNTHVEKSVWFQMPKIRLQAWKLLIFEWGITSFSKTASAFKRQMKLENVFRFMKVSNESNINLSKFNVFIDYNNQMIYDVKFNISNFYW